MQPPSMTAERNVKILIMISVVKIVLINDYDDDVDGY